MVYEKLSQIQSQLFVPKGQKNTFGNYSYRSCEDILKTVKPICESLKCLLLITNDIVEIGGRVYVKATVTLHDLEDATEVVSVAHAREEETKKGMDGSQITGSCISYARKYALAGLFCIDNEKDSDATNKGDSPSPVEDAKLRTELLKKINAQENPTEMLDKVCAAYKVEKLTELTTEQVQKALKRFK